MPLKDDWVDDVDDFYAADQNALAAQVNANTSDIATLESDVSGKAPTTRTVSAGTGLTGGGDLSANRTLAADFGTGAGKVCQGNDSRLSDARTPTTHSHTTVDLPVGTGSNTVAAGNDSRFAAPQAPTSDSTASGSTISTTVTSPRHRSYVTALAAAATIANPSGSPANGWQCIWRIKDNGTDRALTWGSSFRAIGAALPTTTVAGKTLYVPAEYNAADSKWDVFPSAVEA